MPQAYEGTVTGGKFRDEVKSIVEAATAFDLPPLIAREGTWAICTNGLYCLTQSYPILASRFEETDWEGHMSEKTWVDETEFIIALERARDFKRRGYIR
jgi:hypothetical protein